MMAEVKLGDELAEVIDVPCLSTVKVRGYWVFDIHPTFLPIPKRR